MVDGLSRPAADSELLKESIKEVSSKSGSVSDSERKEGPRPGGVS